MKSYDIDLPQSVKNIIREQALFIALDKPQAALEWYDDIFEKLETLSTFPERCPKAPESQYFEFEVRHLIIGAYRVLFRIIDHTVLILDFKGKREYKPE